MSQLRSQLRPLRAITAAALTAAFLFSSSPASAQVNVTLTPSTPGWPTNTAGNTSTFAPGFGISSAQAALAAPCTLLPSTLCKQETYLPASALFPTGPVTIDDVASVTYWTNKPAPPTAVDWYFLFYTVPTGVGDTGSFYHSRLNTEPLYTGTPLANAPTGQWHQWSTGGAFPLKFYDTNRNGGIFGGVATDPTLTQLQAGVINWPAAMSNDYGPEVIRFFSLQTGSCCAAGFTGLVDGLTVTLKDGRFANINFEADIPRDAYQVRYFSNLTLGDSYINISNSGSSTLAGNTEVNNGSICANVYTYSPDEQLVSCCTCQVTPNALASLSVRNDLISNTLTPVVPSSVVVKLVATSGLGTCNAATVGTPGSAGLAPGLEAWGSTLHVVPGPGGLGITETPFSRATLTEPELTRMSQMCAFIRANGSGYGVCKSCAVGGLGARKK